MKLFAYVVIAAVAVAIIAGFFIVGSPREERLRQFDDRRVSNLQTIQGQIIYYWQRKNALPPNLDALDDDISGFRHPHDPESGAEYSYEVTGPESFQLCAVFVRPSSDNVSAVMAPAKPFPGDGGVSMEIWQHGEGRTCFDRKIDKELYPPIKDGKARPI